MKFAVKHTVFFHSVLYDLRSCGRPRRSGKRDQENLAISLQDILCWTSREVERAIPLFVHYYEFSGLTLEFIL